MNYIQLANYGILLFCAGLIYSAIYYSLFPDKISGLLSLKGYRLEESDYMGYTQSESFYFFRSSAVKAFYDLIEAKKQDKEFINDMEDEFYEHGNWPANTVVKSVEFEDKMILGIALSFSYCFNYGEGGREYECYPLWLKIKPVEFKLFNV